MSGNSTERRAAKVASVTGLSSILVIGMQLVTVPLCLKYWGMESYGMWLALLSVTAMLQSTGTGFVSYIGNQINILYHRDQTVLRRTLASSLAGFLFIAAAQLALVLAVIGFDALPRLIGATGVALDAENAEWSLVVLAGSWVVGGFYLGIIHRLLVPTGMMYQAAWWALGHQFGLFLAVIISAVSKFTLLQASVLYAIVQFLIVIASARYVRFKLPEYYPWWRGFRMILGLRDLVRSIPLTVTGFIQQGSGNGLVVLVSAVAGAAAAPAFTTVRTLTNLWTMATNVLTSPLLPDVVRFHAKSEGRKLLAVHETHGVIVGAAVNISILLAYPFVDRVYSFWTSYEVVLDKVLLCTLLASVSLMNLGAMMNTFLTGINHHRSIITSTIVRGGVSLIFGGVMLTQVGLGGIGLGVWAGELFALGFLAYFFINTVRAHTDTKITLNLLVPVSLGVLSVQVYLGAEALGTNSAPFLYPFALGGVMLGAAWGWRRMDGEVRNRLSRLISRQFGV